MNPTKTIMAKKTKKLNKSNLKLEALEQRQLLAGITGSGTEVGSNINHINGNVYDQVLMTGSSVTVTADAGQVTRVSFLDLQGDIVQAEFSGAGTLNVSLAGAVTGQQPSKYVQTVAGGYTQGVASFTIQGSDSTTNLSVFSVGSGNAVNSALFDATHTGGDHTADVAKVTIVANPANPNGSTFGGIFAGNAIFSADSGVSGIAAANVQIQNTVTVGDIRATGTATPTLVFGTASQFGSVTIAGGGLVEANGKAINNTGSYNFGLNFAAGTDSTGAALSAQSAPPTLAFSGNNPTSLKLTTGTDNLIGTIGADTLVAQIGGGAGTDTLTALDSIDGGAGNDTLTINDLASAGSTTPAGLTIKNVETISLVASGVAKLDTSAATITGVTALNVPASTGNDVITAGAGQAVTINDSAGSVTLNGGAAVTITTAGGYIVGATKAPTGAILITDTAQAAVASSVDGGTTVSVTASATANGASTGTIAIGANTAPTGAITLVDNLTGDKASNQSGGAITIKGGTTVSATVNATEPLTTIGANFTLTEPSVTVTGTSTTTAVTVNQSAKVTAATGAALVSAVAGVTETGQVQFANLTAGQTIVLAGLTYTAPSGGATAAKVAASFANLATISGSVGWTSGAVSGTNSDTVTFTSTTSNSNVTDLANTGSGALAAAITETQGAASTASTAATAAKAGITPGVVTITDVNGNASSATIANVSLSNYSSGATITSGALASLSLTGTNSAATTVTISNAAAKTLDLTLNGVSNTTIANTENTYTTVNAHTGTAADSTITALNAGVAALSVDGSKALILSATPGALKTVTVSGSASLTLTGALPAIAGSDINASATSGAVTASIDATVTTYEGGGGTDKLTVTNATPTKVVSGGAGTDTITLNFAGGYAANDKVTGFETLGLGTLASGTYDATGFTNLTNGAVAGAVVYDKVAAGAGLTLTDAPTAGMTYTLKDNTSADSVTVTLAKNANTNYNTLTANQLETVSIVNNTNTSTITLVDTSATTVNVSGGKTLNLTSDLGNTALTTIDASQATGALNYTTIGVTAQTVKGGTAADALVAKAGTSADTLIGNGGNDTLTSNAGLTTLTGGAGSDTFVIQNPGANVNVYTTTDASAGDVLKLIDLGTEAWTADKVSLANTATFQNYVDTIATNSGDVSANAKISWFQFGGDTYVVEAQGHAAATTYTASADLIVRITGLVDLNQSLTVTPAGGAPTISIR